ncbi:unnamed protein product [Ectocarpus sp. 13 AM-2016]
MNCSMEGCTRTRAFESAHADGSPFELAKNVEKADAVLYFLLCFTGRVPALSRFRNKRFPPAR